MKSFSRKASGIHESSTLAVSALANKLKAEGKDVINFGTGEPDFDTPENIKEAAIAAIHAGKTKYTPAAGLPALKEAICGRLEADTGVRYEPNEIVVASGAKHSIYIALNCLLDEGDEVIVPAPYWVTYTEAVAMAGGVPVVVKTRPEEGFKLRPEALEAAITPKTKLLILNNPSNPTGMCYGEEELRALCETAVKHDLWILSDEIYYKLIYDGRKFVSTAALSEEIKAHTILVNGVSKSYAMTGWRIGYTACDAKLSKLMSNYLSHATSAPSTISQWAAIEALNGPQESVEEMRKVFEERRTYMANRMNSLPGVKCLLPEGAFYIMMNIDALVGKTLGGKVIQNGSDFAMAFLEKENVALVPCAGFGEPNYLRWTYAASMEDIRRGLDRLERFLK
ncbi:MAG: pyridoxal phosphate-dependent aminotransferase [Oscillospiraceae bacterium]|nr:pyridoxal phosphate-dependent aminotransferase [Oscillospiraceae bacterium]